LKHPTPRLAHLRLTLSQDRIGRQNSAPKGKLGENLAQQKKQTRTDTLEAAARDERLTREADENTRNLQYS
jgi:hypothetical protein